MSPPASRPSPPVRRRPGLLRTLLVAALGAGLGVGVRAALHRAPEPAPEPEPAPLPGRPRLVAVVGGSLRHGGPERPQEVLLREGRSVLGRARDVDLHLDDPTVSPRHALLEADREGRVELRDLGSLNGLAVDGVPVAHVELHDGNRLQVGGVQLVYRTDPVRDDGGRHGGELGEQIGR